jgi:DNA-binding MarR family transcriptional regulator/GNAT superfamily N-acetyltransferase
MSEPTITPEDEEHVAVLRSFNRMYMQKIGALNEGFYGSPYPLTAVRVLYAISDDRCNTAASLCRELSLDGGYVSRILGIFERDGLILKEKSQKDGRQYELHLTPKGRQVYDDINSRARNDIMKLILPLNVNQRRALVSATGCIRALLEGQVHKEVSQGVVTLRAHRAGDMGLILHNHTVRFAQEYGWNDEFEALVAEKVAEFIRNFNPARDRCWVADLAGQLVGSLFLVYNTDEIGELRLLYVDQNSRGLGIGLSLLNEAIRFARRAGYTQLHMETESVVSHAAALFESVGLKIVRSTPHVRFGKDLVNQQWEMAL